MAFSTSSLFLSASLISLYFISSSRKGPVSDTTVSPHAQTIQVSSLLPSSVCSPNEGPHRKSTLKVVHRQGPCSQLYQDNQNFPSHADILRQDEARVKYIHSRIAKNSGSIPNAAELPAKDGSSIGSPNYIVTVGIGNPQKNLSLIFDTGSDLTWTQCEPCVTTCYEQKETKYDPTESTTYTNISCSSSTCGSLSSATGSAGTCATSTCHYTIKYGDSSYSGGFFATETLTLTSTEVFDDFLFGCGQNNSGVFVGAAGLLGLGRDAISLPSQTADVYQKVFSYCLPSSSSSTGYLSFGDSNFSSSVQFTPLTNVSKGATFYGLNITGLAVGGQNLSIPSSVFTTAGAIIDSGTVITRLPPDAYSALRSAFREQMSQYPLTSALSVLDTCYDLSNYTSVSIPTVNMFFEGGVKITLYTAGSLYITSISQVCLAFAGNTANTSVAILGNVQQKTLQVVHDGAGERIGFASGGCS